MNLVLSLTHQCNLRCTYCYSGPKETRRMSPQVLERALDLGFDTADPLVYVLPFGGEPLLEPGLIEAMAVGAKARADRTGKRLRLGLTTNGTLLTEGRLDLLERHGFRVTVSLDGDRAAHDCARVLPDGRGSFDDALAGLRRARRRLGEVRVSAVVHPGNAARLGDSFDCFADEGVTWVSFSPDYSAPWDAAALADLAGGTERLADRVIARYRAGVDVAVQPLHGKVVSRLKEGYAPRDRCDFGCGEVAVAPSGNLYPCDRLIGADGPEQADVLIGHVDTGIDVARVAALRSVKDTAEPECQRCAIVDRCQWWCGCQNRAMTGRIDTPGDLLCHFEQAAVQAADRVAATLFAEDNAPFVRRYYAPLSERNRAPAPSPQLVVPRLLRRGQG
jgi:uncharacterized protein